MSNKLFSNLRKKLTLQYSLIFGIIILAIVFASYAFTWWSILAIEKQELHAKAIHEAEEWISSKEAPVNEKELATEEMLAYFVEADRKTIIINQMGNGPAGKALMRKQHHWPILEGRDTRLLRVHSEDKSKHFRYLATVCEVKPQDKVVGYLYMFENMETYYTAGFKTLQKLLGLFLILFSLAGFGSFWLSGRNLKPISEAYDKQKQFTADASHEMRTPLAVMKLGVQGIKEDDETQLSDFSSNTLAMLDQEVDRLTRLTENLMTLARNDSNNYTVEFTTVKLSELCHKIASQLQLVASEKNITIQCHLQSNVTLLAEEASINRLLIILLDNAIKYSPADTSIVIELTNTKNTILLKVIDQGSGINDVDKPKIFDRFFRLDKARSRSMGGLGLGLSLAKAIVDRHHGKIWVEDNKPQGCVFIIQLPHKQ